MLREKTAKVFKGKNKKDLLKSTILILKIPCMGGQASSTMES